MLQWQCPWQSQWQCPVPVAVTCESAGARAPSRCPRVRNRAGNRFRPKAIPSKPFTLLWLLWLLWPR